MAGGRQLTVTLVANTKSFNKGMMDSFRAAEGFKGKMSALGSSLSMMAGPALAGAAAAAGAFAIKLGVDGVKAAIADQQAAEKLTQTLNNLGLAHDNARIEDFIFKMQMATGVVDDDLRPAYERLVRSTQDTNKAMSALQIAVDISAGKGKSLESVANALGKAYDGNTNALGRLGLGLDSTLLKSGNIEAITSELSRLFAGQASTAANTWAGRIQRISVAFDELKESFGTGFLNALEQNQTGTDGLQKSLEDLMPIAQQTGEYIGQLANAVAGLGQIAGSITGVTDGMPEWLKTVGSFAWRTVDPVHGLVMSLSDLSQISQQNAKIAELQNAVYRRNEGRFQATSKATRLLTEAMDGQSAVLDSVTSGTTSYTDEISLLRSEINRTTVRLGFLSAAFDEANAAMERRQAMQDYRDALKAFVQDPSAQTRDAAVQAMMDVASSMKDPAQQGRFVSQAFDDITGAAQKAGVGVPPDLAKIGTAAEQQLDPVASLKKAMEEIPNYIPIKIDLQLPSRSLVDGNGNGIPDVLEIATGGPVFGAGGYVGARMGTHASDSIRARLSRGEYVLNADTVKRLGVGTLNRLNNGGAAGGGMVIEQLNVSAAPGERAEDSVPRALRRMAFVAGLNG